jgi:fatty acid desaturase
MKHHQFTVHHGLDGEVVLPQKFPLLNWLLIFTINLPGLYYLIRTHLYYSFGKIPPEAAWTKEIFPESAPKKRSELFNWSRVILIGHAVLIGLCIAAGEWILIPIALTPFYCGWLATLCGFPQHAGLPPDVPDFRKSCRTMLLNPVSAYFYWNMHYHIEHHMYASVPFFKLPKLHKAIAHDCPPPCRSMREAWKEIMAVQKRQESDPDYTFDNFKRGQQAV